MERKINKKILITGATGFLGSRLAAYLHTLNPTCVIATGRNKNKLELLKNQGIQCIQGDLTDRNFVLECAKEVDYIVHAAALSSPWGDYSQFYQANVVSTDNLLFAAKKHHLKRFIHISTPSIYYQFKDARNVREEDPLPKRFVNAYAATKYLAELRVNDAFSDGLECITLRPRAIYGAGDETIMPRLIRAQESGRLKVIGSGNNVVDLTHVRNVIEAICLSIEATEEALGKTYNITDGAPVKLWEVLQNLLLTLGYTPSNRKIPHWIAHQAAFWAEQKAKWLHPQKEPIITKYGIGVLAHSMTLDISKAKKHLKYQPVINLEKGLEEFVDWWKSL